MKSNKFLTVCSDQYARDERECRVVKLSSAGNTNSWLQILPRHKIDKEGSVITNNKAVIFKLIDIDSYIHCAEIDPPYGCHHEVNCSTDADPSPWLLNIFQSSKEILQNEALHPNTLVMITDPEVHAALSIVNHTNYTNLSYPKKRTSIPVNNSIKSKSKSPNTYNSYGDDVDIGDCILMSLEVPEQDAKRSVSEDVDSNVLWILESNDIVNGGAIHSNGFHLRHLNTGLYLTLKVDSIFDTNNFNPNFHTVRFTSSLNPHSTQTILESIEYSTIAMEHIHDTAPRSALPDVNYDDVNNSKDNNNTSSNPTSLLRYSNAVILKVGNFFISRGSYIPKLQCYHTVASTESFDATKLVLKVYGGHYCSPSGDQSFSVSSVSESTMQEIMLEGFQEVFVGCTGALYLQRYLPLLLHDCTKGPSRRQSQTRGSTSSGKHHYRRRSSSKVKGDNSVSFSSFQSESKSEVEDTVGITSKKYLAMEESKSNNDLTSIDDIRHDNNDDNINNDNAIVAAGVSQYPSISTDLLPIVARSQILSERSSHRSHSNIHQSYYRCDTIRVLHRSELKSFFCIMNVLTNFVSGGSLSETITLSDHKDKNNRLLLNYKKRNRMTHGIKNENINNITFRRKRHLRQQGCIKIIMEILREMIKSMPSNGQKSSKKMASHYEYTGGFSYNENHNISFDDDGLLGHGHNEILPDNEQVHGEEEEEGNTVAVESNQSKFKKKILKSCLKLLYNCISGHMENQIYVADYLDVLLAHVGTQPIAAKCVTEMLSNNIELQQTKVGYKEIEIFVDKLRSSPLNPLYLRLLSSCCTCMGKGVDKNQCAIVEELLSKDSGCCVIQIQADYSEATPIDWINSGTIFLPVSSSLLSPGFGHISKLSVDAENEHRIMGDVLLTKGLPKLNISWTYAKTECSPLHLFGKENIPIEELFSPSKSTKVSLTRSKRSTEERGKESIAEFFTMQMNLFADLCLDRNYVAISKLERMFPYDVLVSILKSFVNDALKAAVLRFLSALYVDREPQNVTPIPCMSRLWSEICLDKDPSIPGVDEDNQYKFSLLQVIISEYLNDMSDRLHISTSQNIIHLLHLLIIFGFYNTNEKVEIVANALRLLLNRKDMKQFSLHMLYDQLKEDSTSNTDSSMLNSSVHASNILENESVQAMEDIHQVTDNNNNKNNSKKDAITNREKKEPWQLPTYRFLESIVSISLIVMLVLIAISVQLYVTITDSSGLEFSVFEYVVAFCFCFEFSLRFYCTYFVEKKVMNFLRNVFNQLDMFVIAVDIFFIASDNLFPQASYTKGLRAFRLFRLVRLLRAARLVNRMVGMNVIKHAAWEHPKRYDEIQESEAMCLSLIADTFSDLQTMREDLNLSLFLKGFALWERQWATTRNILNANMINNSSRKNINNINNKNNNNNKQSLVEIFYKVAQDENILLLYDSEFDINLIDLLMYTHETMTQSILNILVSRYFSMKMLKENVCRVQLIISTERENKFLRIREMLLKIERYAETYELWGNLKTRKDEDIYEETITIFSELAKMCHCSSFTLHFGAYDEISLEIQTILRNLGCFEVCLKYFDLVHSVKIWYKERQHDDTVHEIVDNNRFSSTGGSSFCDDRKEHHSNTSGSNIITEILSYCNELLYCFLYENLLNQEIGFKYMDYFITNIDKNIRCDKVIKAIFKNNEMLCERCPRKYIMDMIDNICMNGHQSCYLALLSSITTVLDKNVEENQYEIVTQITLPSKMDSILLYCVDGNHPQYRRKIASMKCISERVKDRDIKLDEIPSDLRYHVELIDVLSGCVFGRVSSTIEAKIQSAYPFTHVINAMLDPDTILVARSRLGRFLYHSTIDSTLSIAGFEYLALVWNLLKSFIDIFAASVMELQIVCREKNWDVPGVSRHRIEYMLICCMVVSGFFLRYYDKKRFEENWYKYRTDRVQWSKSVIDQCVTSLYIRLKYLSSFNFKCLSDLHKTMIQEAVESVGKNVNKRAREFDAENDGFLVDSNLLTYSTKESQVTENTEEVPKIENNVRDLTETYEIFLSDMFKDSKLVLAIAQEQNPFVQRIEDIPLQYVNDISDVRLEPFLAKLVNHIRGGLEKMDNITRMDPQYVKTSIWVLKMFLSMIENKWGVSMSVYDDSSSVEQDQAAEPITRILNDCGVTALCLDLMSVEVEDSLMIECLKLAQALLMKEGGCAYVQETMYQHLTSTKSELFFKEARVMLQKLNRWHSVTSLGRNAAASTEPTVLPYYIMLLRFLQLMCEGHFLKNQDAIRDQPFNESSVNLLDDLVMYLSTMSKLSDKLSVKAALQTCATLLDAIQGPCMGNQLHLALNTQLIETLNRLLRAPVVDDDEEGYELKIVCVDIFLGLLEGQGRKSAVYERVLSVIHLDIIYHASCSPTVADEISTAGSTTLQSTFVNQSKIALSKYSATQNDYRAKCLVLLKSLQDYDPNVLVDFGLSSAEIEVDNVCGVTSIELNWRGELQRRFFRIPDICTGLSDHSKAVLVQEVDRSNQENKLFDFVSRCKDLYRELKHEQLLKKWNINFLFNRIYTNYLKWFTFVLTCFINLLMICYYTSTEGELHIPLEATVAIKVLNIFQLFCALLILILVFVIHVPVRYSGYYEDGVRGFRLFYMSLLDPSAIYYTYYSIICVLGLEYSNGILSLLLLDIISKNSVARNIMNAVVYPHQQLAVTFLLGVFVSYICAFFMVRLFC